MGPKAGHVEHGAKQVVLTTKGRRETILGLAGAHAEIWLISKPMTTHCWQPTCDNHSRSCALQSSKHWTSPALTQSEQSSRHAGKSPSYEYEYEDEYSGLGQGPIEVAENGLPPCNDVVVRR